MLFWHDIFSLRGVYQYVTSLYAEEDLYFPNMTEPFVLMFLISYVATHLLYLLSLCYLSFHESWLSFGNLMKAIRVNLFDGNEM